MLLLDKIQFQPNILSKTGQDGRLPNKTCVWYPRKMEALEDNNAVNYTFDSFSKEQAKGHKIDPIIFF